MTAVPLLRRGSDASSAFHFDVAPPVEKLPQLLDDPRARHEHLPRLLIGD